MFGDTMRRLEALVICDEISAEMPPVSCRLTADGLD